MDALTTAPRWFLVLTLGAACSLAAWQEIKWRAGVESHLSQSLHVYQRISALEARVEAHEAWCRQRHGE